MILETEELQLSFDELSVEEQEQIERDTARSDFMGASPDVQYSMYQMALPYADKDVYWNTIVECYNAYCVEPAVS